MPIQKRVSELPAATGITGADLLVMSSATATRRVSFNQIVGYLSGQGIGVGPTGPAGSGAAYSQPTAPASAPEGATWFSTTDGRYFTRYDDVWVEVGFYQG